MLFIAFIITAILIVLIAAVFAPMGVLFNTQMYAAGEMMLNQSQTSLNSIQDSTVRNEINASITSAKASAQDNIEINASIFQYGWVLMIGVTALVVFIYTRRLSEFNGGFI